MPTTQGGISLMDLLTQRPAEETCYSAELTMDMAVWSCTLWPPEQQDLLYHMPAVHLYKDLPSAALPAGPQLEAAAARLSGLAQDATWRQAEVRVFAGRRRRTGHKWQRPVDLPVEDVANAHSTALVPLAGHGTGSLSALTLPHLILHPRYMLASVQAQGMSYRKDVMKRYWEACRRAGLAPQDMTAMLHATNQVGRAS